MNCHEGYAERPTRRILIVAMGMAIFCGLEKTDCAAQSVQTQGASATQIPAAVAPSSIGLDPAWVHPENMIVVFMTQILPYDPRQFGAQVRDLAYAAAQKSDEP